MQPMAPSLQSLWGAFNYLCFQERKLAYRGEAQGHTAGGAELGFRPRSVGLQGLRVHWGSQEGFMEEDVAEKVVGGIAWAKVWQ